MNLVEFLLARIAEDEAGIGDYDSDFHEGGPSWQVCESPEYPTVYVSHRRMRAECKAKRDIIAAHPDYGAQTDQKKQIRTYGWEYHACSCHDGVPDTWPCETLLAIAAVYADHSDYPVSGGKP